VDEAVPHQGHQPVFLVLHTDLIQSVFERLDYGLGGVNEDAVEIVYDELDSLKHTPDTPRGLKPVSQSSILTATPEIIPSFLGESSD
jgi:hypothetical protein